MEMTEKKETPPPWQRIHPDLSILGRDPGERTKFRLNVNSFQQSALISFKQWQYAAFYTCDSEPDGDGTFPRYVTLARRNLCTFPPEESKRRPWELLTFHDYKQTTDDGHNIISIGICFGDGTIHVSFDHHCDPLHYRISQPGAALEPDLYEWSPQLFSPVRNHLPGLPSATSSTLREITYPRFVSHGDDLVFTHRIGQAGAGSDVLYIYRARTHEYTLLGTYLTGVNNNPYINGMDSLSGCLYVSWCYREFVEFDNSSGTAHKQQAGPNGPENNRDLGFMYSEDDGQTWCNNSSRTICDLSRDETVKPDTEGAVVLRIPKNSGILNQESQAADSNGGFHVLNREKRHGQMQWIHYYRDSSGVWISIPILNVIPTETGNRGSIGVDRKNNVFFLLPSNTDSSLSLLASSPDSSYREVELLWKGTGYDGEPLIDIERLKTEDILSVFTRIEPERGGSLIVIDFHLYAWSSGPNIGESDEV
ncbi:MAG: hypothetical protein M1834_002757 [Cirrosporium novae-zelandiae]|nr:MAG: hypothetical protein M1834_002757 [Cirrosporium novae-zelandiae]